MSKRLKGDLLWAGALLLCVAALLIKESRNIILEFTTIHPYVSGFIKFFILATMGDLIGSRIRKKEWLIPSHFFFKACVWGILGMMITLVFSVFMGGVESAQEAGRLPWAGIPLATAFFASLTMNTTFGPMLYIYHKLGDYIVDKIFAKKIHLISGEDFSKKINWPSMVSFFWLKTCLFIWLPLHTLVFMLPPEYRVIASAFLSILLGVIVAMSKLSAQRKAS